MALILDGKKVRDEIAVRLADQVARLKEQPGLAIIQIGDNSASNTYIRQKKIFGEKIGVKVEHHKLAKTVAASEVKKLIGKLNRDEKIHGIILQFPVPAHLDANLLIEQIDPGKDVDGLTAANVKKLWTGDHYRPSGSVDGLVPATARGVITLLDYYKISVEGKRAVVAGRSNLVGKPIAALLLARGATVIICHRGTLDLAAETKRAELIIAAIGQPKLLRVEHFTMGAGQVVIDVGISRDDDQLVGDVDFVAVEPLVAAISPVPGGVGPLTVASLFANLFEAYKRQNN